MKKSPCKSKIGIPKDDLSSQYQTQEQKDNALIAACERGDTKKLASLISIGANPKTCGNQAIVWACFTKNINVFKELSKYYQTQELKSLIASRVQDIPPFAMKILKQKATIQLGKSISETLGPSKLIEI